MVAIHNGRVDSVLLGLLEDTDVITLAQLSEWEGQPRIPGLPKEGYIQRLLATMDREMLRNRLIAAHFEGLSTTHLLTILLEEERYTQMHAGKPRLESIARTDVTLQSWVPGIWRYTVHGYAVEVDLAKRRVACECRYFEFSARRDAICKHIAVVLEVLPEAYSRPALIDMLLTIWYGGEPWRFDSR